LAELQHAFKLYDVDRNGNMSEKEFKNVLIDLGRREVTDEQVKEMLREADENGDGFLQWGEFIEVSRVLTESCRCSGS
jgi:Ca2+-binding EF-hand superfamily protein